MDTPRPSPRTNRTRRVPLAGDVRLARSPRSAPRAGRQLAARGWCRGRSRRAAPGELRPETQAAGVDSCTHVETGAENGPIRTLAGGREYTVGTRVGATVGGGGGAIRTLADNRRGPHRCGDARRQRRARQRRSPAPTARLSMRRAPRSLSSRASLRLCPILKRERKGVLNDFVQTGYQTTKPNQIGSEKP